MIFNSIEFAIFLPIVFILYWVLSKDLRKQNFLILIASYIFYGWWDWRFLFLIFASSIIDYFVGIGIGNASSINRKKHLLHLSLLVNLGLLGTLKYFNFFIDSFADAFTLFGSNFETNRLNIILPVGISFYTFQTLSYSIDVYKGRLKPTKDIIAFLAFVSFFPQLVAGPIERATNLIPQFLRRRKFDYPKAVDGMRQILWGLFKKMVIADNCATYVNQIFDNYQEMNGSTLMVGGILFAFQIYGDFSGYSDIAIGTSRLFGFNLMKNFAFPYFSRDIAEFWRRWHISLSTWFRDYVYIPLGGSRGTLIMQVRNVFIIFLLSGFWHGANWTFIVWGGLNAIYFLPLLVFKLNRKNTDTVAQGKVLPGVKELFQMSVTFFITVIAWIFFRADSISHALQYLDRLFSYSFLEKPMAIPNIFLFLLGTFLLVEWLQREKNHGLQISFVKVPRVVNWVNYLIIIFLIFLFSGQQQKFIYFQF